jgi:hypothetical protein
MFPARSGITFAATTEQPLCNDKLEMEDSNGVVELQCTLVHGHRQKRHYYSGTIPDRDGMVEFFWPKKRVERNIRSNNG